MGASSFKNTFVLLSALVVLVAIGSVLVSSAFSVSSVTVNSPSTRQGEAGTIIGINISVNNTDATNITYVNITMGTGNKTFITGSNRSTGTSLAAQFSNVSAFNISWFNGSGLINNVTETIAYFLFNVTIGNETNGTINFFNVTIQYKDGSHNSTTFNITAIDTTKPTVTAIGLPAANANVSGNVTINVTGVHDATLNPSSAFVNVSNSSNTGNATVTLFNSTGGNTFNGTLNTNTLADGKYNITFSINDSANNINNTLVVTIIIDNTAPTASLAFRENSASGTILSSTNPGRPGFPVHPTCTTADATTIVSSTTLTGTSPSSVALTGLVCGTVIDGTQLTEVGTYTINLKATDVNSNNVTVTGTFTVLAAADTGGAATGGTTATTETSASSIVSAGSIKADQEVRVPITKTVISEVAFTPSKAGTEAVTIKVTELQSRPADVTADPPGTNLGLLKVDHDKLANENVKSAKIKFKVAKSKVGADEQVSLARWDGSAWTKLKTTKTGEEGDYLLFEAESPGLSVFAIVAEKKPSVTVRASVDGNKVTVTASVENFNIVDKVGQVNVADEGHVHFYLDDQYVPVGRTTYTFENVAIGTHTVKAELHNNDHSAVAGVVAATTSVVVEEKKVEPTKAPVPSAGVDPLLVGGIVVVIVVILAVVYFVVMRKK